MSLPNDTKFFRRIVYRVLTELEAAEFWMSFFILSDSGGYEVLILSIWTLFKSRGASLSTEERLRVSWYVDRGCKFTRVFFCMVCFKKMCCPTEEIHSIVNQVLPDGSPTSSPSERKFLLPTIDSVLDAL